MIEKTVTQRDRRRAQAPPPASARRFRAAAPDRGRRVSSWESAPEERGPSVDARRTAQCRRRSAASDRLPRQSTATNPRSSRRLLDLRGERLPRRCGRNITSASIATALSSCRRRSLQDLELCSTSSLMKLGVGIANPTASSRPSVETETTRSTSNRSGLPGATSIAGSCTVVKRPRDLVGYMELTEAVPPRDRRRKAGEGRRARRRPRRACSRRRERLRDPAGRPQAETAHAIGLMIAIDPARNRYLIATGDTAFEDAVAASGARK